MKNKLQDLNDHLFAQLERLSDETLTEEQIQKETVRTEAIVSVASKIVDNASVQLKAMQLVADHAGRVQMPNFLSIENRTGQATSGQKS